MTLDQALRWVDQRLELWIALRKSQYGEDYCRRTTFATRYELVDHFRFPTPFSPTRYAEGSHSPSGAAGPDVKHYIKACLYTKAEAATKPASFPYPDMAEERDGLWKWGVFPADGVGFAVLQHEMDHAVGIGH